MNFDLAFQILQLAVRLLQSHSRSPLKSNAEIADILKEIAAAALQAHREHTGEPLDPFSIKAEPAV
jgi:hypothetical protein